MTARENRKIARFWSVLDKVAKDEFRNLGLDPTEQITVVGAKPAKREKKKTSMKKSGNLKRLERTLQEEMRVLEIDSLDDVAAIKGWDLCC